MLKTTPAVFAVGNEYQIMVEVEQESLFWVKVGDEVYDDASNGIMNSLSNLHRVKVPMQVLNCAKAYTVCVKPIVERKPYFTETEETKEYDFVFRSVPSQKARAYHIADTHNLIKEPVCAAQTYGEIDFLILNGDVIDHSGSPDKFQNIYEICEALTRGEIPVVFSRGNHDMRGRYAEKFAEYTPNCNGNTYYTFRLGSIWGVVLDCGEDKPDSNEEYGFTVACHTFRQQQTDFLKAIVANAKQEYEAEGVETKIVIAHTPFTQKDVPPFDIEEDIYREWCEILRNDIQPSLMICGHTHVGEIRQVGSEHDTYGQPCTVVIGSAFDDKAYWKGCGICFGEGVQEVMYTDCEGIRMELSSV